MEQAAPFKPGFTLGERAESIEQTPEGHFIVTTNSGTIHKAPNIAIAGGLGCFEPRKPPIENLATFENRGVEYIVKDPEKFRNKRIVIAGGGDSALDWTIFLKDVASEITMIHRRTQFRGHLDSVQKVMDMASNGEINLMGIATDEKDDVTWVDCDYFLPLFGLSPKLGPIAEWGLNISKSAIVVNTLDYSTNIPGIYAIGDVNTYPGKLKLILCGFHEATLMVQSAFKRIYPHKNNVLKYTTVNGIQGF